MPAMRSTAALLAAALVCLLPLPAQAAAYGQGCDPELKPASIVRVERVHPDRPITNRTWVRHQASRCIEQDGHHLWLTWTVHTREWKRYGRDTARPCEMWARSKDVSSPWSAWRLVPWGTATNC